MRKIIAGLGVVLILGLIIATRLGGKPSDIDQKENTITVGAVKAVRQDITTYKEYVGNIVADQTVSVLPNIVAKVKQIYVQVGDYVPAQAELFRLDSDGIDNQLAQANSGLVQAQIGIKNADANISKAQLAYQSALDGYTINSKNYDFAKQNLEKNKQLFEQGIISEVEYEQMKLQAQEGQLSIYQNQLEQAKTQLNQAKLAKEQAVAAYNQAQTGVTTVKDTIQDTTVLAPIDGYVTKILISQENYAGNTQPAVVIEKLDQLKLTVDLTGNQINQVKPGQAVQVEITDISRQVDGIIETIALSANERTLLYPLTISIANPDLQIKPGMFAKVKLIHQQSKNALLIPSEAVAVRDKQTVVFVQTEEHSVEKRVIRKGIDDGKQVEIVDGIKEQEIVINQGVGLISETTKVDVIVTE